MATCNAQTLMTASSTFLRLTPQQLQVIIAQLLCEIRNMANPLATCDTTALMAAGKCFDCLTPQQIQVIQAQLLCEILNGGGGGGTCIICTAGAPTDPAPCACSIAYSLPPNAGVWVWDSVNAKWEVVIEPGV